MDRPAPRRAGLLLAAVLLAVGAVAGTAAAHAVLIGSSPGNDETVQELPSRVLLDFDEAMQAPGDSPVVVLDPSGAQVQTGAVELGNGGRSLSQGIDTDTRGTHTVSYRVVSEDGHLISGSYVFHVGAVSSSATASPGESGTAEVVGFLGRLLAYAGSLLAVGAAVVAIGIDRARPPRGVWLGAGTLAVVGSALTVWALAIALGGSGLLPGAAAFGDVFDTFGWGPGPPLRMALALGFVVAVVLARWWRPMDDFAAALAVALLLVPSFAGHASVESVAAELVDALHVLAAAVWVGGLAALVLTWNGDRGRLVGFGRLAVVAAVVVVLTGTANAWWQLAAVGDLVSTDWGRTLVVKLVAVAAVLLLGWRHRRRLMGSDAAVTRRSFGVEVGVAVLVLAVTSVLVDTPPPSSEEAASEEAAGEEAAGSTSYVRQAGEVTVRLRVQPGSAGPNDLLLYFLDLDGSLVPVDAAEVRVGSDEVAPRRIELTPVTPSHWAAEGVDLSPGTWDVEVTVVSSGSTASTTFEVPIP